MRFGAQGVIGNVLFLVLYNGAVGYLEDVYAASTIYSLVFFWYIPVGHAISSMLVFGWPSPYLPSLLKNYPIGLTTMALGAFTTAYLDDVQFNESCEDFIRAHLQFMAPMSTDEDDKGEFYSSLLVSILTGVWSYALSVWVNSSSQKNTASDEKKEL